MKGVVRDRLLVPCLAIVIAFVVAPQATEAAVVKGDWILLGDGLVTRDLTSNLEWLDLRQTMNGNLNRSFDDINSQLGLGGEFAGFRHATENELLGLWSSAGIPDINAGGTAANFVPVSNLIMLMDNTSANPIATQFSFGILANSNSSGTHQAAMIDVTAPGFARARAFAQDVGDVDTNISGGHFLVRVSAVPEPSSAYLLAAMVGLIYIASRRRRIAKLCMHARN